MKIQGEKIGKGGREKEEDRIKNRIKLPLDRIFWGCKLQKLQIMTLKHTYDLFINVSILFVGQKLSK